ncbi:energy transducer TonB [Chlamydiota bacterium]
MKRHTVGDSRIFVQALLFSLFIHVCSLVMLSYCFPLERGIIHQKEGEYLPLLMVKIGALEQTIANHQILKKKALANERYPENTQEQTANQKRRIITRNESNKNKRITKTSSINTRLTLGQSGKNKESSKGKIQHYLSAMRKKIEASKYFPQTVSNHVFYGEVTVQFSITENGSIHSLSIKEPSTHSFNKAAYDIIAKSAPFPPPEEHLQLCYQPILVTLFFVKE